MSETLPAWIATLLLGVIAILLALLVLRAPQGGLPLPGDSDFVAVLLENGTAYYGRPEPSDRDALVLTDVYYIRRVDAGDGKQRNVLVKRGQEVHGPTRMVIPLAAVSFLEPVARGSEIARLIGEANASPAPAAAGATGGN